MIGFNASAELTVDPPVIEAGGWLEIEAASSGTVPMPSDSEDVDGCDVQVEVPTADEDLPAAEGGVA